MNSSLFLEAVTDAARVAGSAALGYATSFHVENKPDGSPVTNADRAAERQVRDWIERRFPEHGIVGEELGAVREGATYRWLVDPIDGTQSFVHGVPLWGTLIGVLRGNEPIAGAIFCPAVDELMCAASGAGCWLNGAAARVSPVQRLSEGLVLTTDERFTHTPSRATLWRRLAAQARMARGWGDCYGFLLVAAGRAEAMVNDTFREWDAAALYPCIREAGGVIADWNGREDVFGDGAIATNAAISDEVRRVLGTPLVP
jgi:histidinol phosphatase-like enzyme (inositol monophosphatase family)